MDHDSDEENALEEEDYYAFLNVPKDVSSLQKAIIATVIHLPQIISICT